MSAPSLATKPFCNYLKQHVSFGVSPAILTRDWIETLQGGHVGQTEYLSRQVLPFTGPNPSGLLRIPDVRSLVQDDRVWLAVRSEIIEAIAEAVRAEAPVADEIVQGQDLKLVPGHAAFPSAVSYAAHAGKGWAWGRHWDLGPKLRSGIDEREVPRWRVEQGFLGEVDFRLILRSAGKLVEGQDPETIPMSFNFAPVKVISA